MHECLDRHVRFGANRSNLVNRKLARDDNTLDAELLGEFDCFGTGHRHLRRSVERQVGADLASQPSDSDVLDQNRINAARRDNSN